MFSRSFTTSVALALVAAPLCTGVALTSPNTPPKPSLKQRQVGTVYTDCNNANDVALTFDDGPYIYHTDIANTLSDAGILGTFFVNGANFDCIYDARQVTSLRASYAAGHQIASHTWSHPDLTTLNQGQIRSQLQRINTALQKILGVVPSVMRPPYGSSNDQVKQVASDLGQSLVLWNFDSEDANGATPDASKQAYTDLANRHPSSVISLQHETIPTTANDVLPFAIQTLKDANYNFVTIAECIGIPAYQSTQDPGQRDSSWTCS